MARNFVHDTFPTGLPVGRLVQGDCYDAQARRDATGKPVLHQPGHALAGQPVMQHYLLVAYGKTDPAFLPFRAFLADEAKLAWPQYHDAAGNCTNPTFASKIIDGDSRDEKGKPWADREGFAGHYVVRYASTFAPKVMEWDPALGGWKETEKGKIKLGDYIQVSGSTQSNNSAQSPGMHVNPSIIGFVREGERIVLGITADQALGAGPGGAGPGGAPAAGGATPPPPPAPATGPVRPTDPSHIGHAGTPNEVWWTGSAWIPAPTASAPPPPPAPTAPPAPPAPPAEPYTGFMETKVLLPAAGATTYAQYREAGWSDEQLIASGYMAAPAA